MIHTKFAFVIILICSFYFLPFGFSASAKSISKEDITAFVTIKANVPKEYKGTISINYEQIDGQKVGSIMVGLTPLNEYCSDGIYYVGTYKKVSILLSDSDYYVAIKDTLNIQSKMENSFTFIVKKDTSPKNAEIAKSMNNSIKNNKDEFYINIKDKLFSYDATSTTVKNNPSKTDNKSKSVHGEHFSDEKKTRNTNKRNDNNKLIHFLLDGGITLILLIVLSIVYFVRKNSR